MVEEYEYQIKATEGTEGPGAKGKQREKSCVQYFYVKGGPGEPVFQVRSIGMVLYWSSRQKNYCQRDTNKFSVLVVQHRGNR